MFSVTRMALRVRRPVYHGTGLAMLFATPRISFSKVFALAASHKHGSQTSAPPETSVGFNLLRRYWLFRCLLSTYLLRQNASLLRWSAYGLIADISFSG